MADISVLIGFHREGLYAHPSLQSLAELVGEAERQGLVVEVLATLDNVDAETSRIVGSAAVDKIVEVAAGDIAGARNAGIAAATGDYIAILDGDDLWGSDWLARAHAAARSDQKAIWHPEYVYAFNEADFRFGLPTEHPHHETASCFMRHQELDASVLDIRELALENPWTAHSFGPAEVYRKHPYRLVDPRRGLGIEDYSWNIETILDGYRHRVVRDTVHMYRVNRPGSQNANNNLKSYLPYLPDNFWDIDSRRAGSAGDT